MHKNILKLKPQADIQDFITDILDQCVATSNPKQSIIPRLDRALFMDYEKIQRIQINRNEERRLKKLSCLQNHLATHDEIALFVVLEGFFLHLENDRIWIAPGVYLANGNTRRLYYKNFPDYLPTTDLIATVHIVENAQEYKDLYYSYDNMVSGENGPDLVTGAMGATHVNVTSTVAKNGGFKSALDIAYGDNTATVADKVSFFKDEIELLDRVGIFTMNKKLKCQTMYAACLMAAKYWNQPVKTFSRMVSGLQTLAQTSADSGYVPNTQDWDGLTAMMYEWFTDGSKGWVAPDVMRKTNFASIEPQMDFLLYCFELYMKKVN